MERSNLKPLYQLHTADSWLMTDSLRLGIVEPGDNVIQKFVTYIFYCALLAILE